jgi:hypothetical protein
MSRIQKNPSLCDTTEKRSFKAVLIVPSLQCLALVVDGTIASCRYPSHRFKRDTDILPRLEFVHSAGTTAVGLATGKNQSELKMSPQPKDVSLDKPHYMRSQDTTNYS